MPIHKTSGGEYQWGSHGTKYSTREGAEKQAAAAHANGFTGDKEPIRGAGIMFLTPKNEALFLLRSPSSNNPHMWDLPGGKADDNETPEETAERESQEEIGACPYGEMSQIADTQSNDDDGHNVGFITYRKFIMHQFTPKLDKEEHTDYRWATLDDAPEPLHPGVREVVDIALGDKPTVAKDSAAGVLAPKSGGGMAFDRASVRSVDQDGRMRVELSHISKAMVCPYLGDEIPDYEQLGLDGDKVYMLLRDPDELKKSVDTWNSVPLLNDHVPVSAADHKPENVVGATGTDAQFNSPYLDNSLVVWVQESIDLINSGEQQEISCAYYYMPDMTPGTYQGVAYDGVMRNIRANHVALVPKGRAGPDVLVNDYTNPEIMQRMNMDKLRAMDANFKGTTEPVITIGNSINPSTGAMTMAKTALSKKAILAKGILLGKIAADSHLDLNQVLAGVKRKNWLAKKPGIAAAIKPHLAKDANLDQVIDLLDRLDGMDDNDMSQDDDMDDMDAAMDDGCEAIMSKLRGKIADDDLSEIEGMLKARGMPKNAAEDEDDDKAKEKADEDKTASDEDEDDDKKAAEDEDEDEDKDKMKKDKEDKMDKAAMDRAIKLACDATAKDAERKTIARMRAIAEAEELVKPFVGKLTAMDSAEDVLKAALIALNVDVKDVHPSAYRTILKYIPNPSEPTHQASGLATDRSISPTSDMYDIFPNLLTK